ncbi:MAG TPA: carboxymuconolactone decarboxylase family protein [Actinomycetales bacterium]|nr:carboxymuconolactone decarboxylase family protein [Actinomycetales bacterium]
MSESFPERPEPLREGRLPLLAPETLDDGQRAVYDAITGGPRAGGPFRVVDDQGRLAGPFNAMLHAPAIGQAVQQLGAALRFSGVLPARTRELVICAVAAHWDSDYEWYAHSRVAASVGVTPSELAGLRDRRAPAGLAPGEAAALGLALSLLADRAVDDGTYAAAQTHHGHAGVVELALLVGYYQALAGLLATADVPAPLDHPETA